MCVCVSVSGCWCTESDCWAGECRGPRSMCRSQSQLPSYSSCPSEGHTCMQAGAPACAHTARNKKSNKSKCAWNNLVIVSYFPWLFWMIMIIIDASSTTVCQRSMQKQRMSFKNGKNMVRIRVHKHTWNCDAVFPEFSYYPLTLRMLLNYHTRRSTDT